MSVKSANVTARVEPDVKIEAEHIINELGLSVSAVINSLYKQIILRGGLPYSLTLPTQPKSIEAMSREEFDSMLSAGIEDVKAGNTIPVDKAFDELLKGL